jgi:anti-anti-sigma factor
MIKQPFHAEVNPQANAALIDLHGELNAFAEQELNRAYEAAEKLNLPVIILNFTDVDYINSTGIALIVNILGRARKNQHRLVVYGLSEHYQEIFSITRLTDFMQIAADRDSAFVEAGD